MATTVTDIGSSIYFIITRIPLETPEPPTFANTVHNPILSYFIQ